MTEEVRDEDALLRRVPDHPDMWTTTEAGQIRPTSVSMKPSSEDEGLSVDLRRLLDDPANPLTALAGSSGPGLAELLARVARRLDLDVVHDPLPGNPAHANVVGFAAVSKNKAKRKQKHLAEAAAWIRMPDGALGAP